MAPLAILLLASFIAPSLENAVTLRVEHRWGQEDFTEAGSFAAPVSFDGTVLDSFQFHRKALTQQQYQSFTECAYKNGLYSLRVQSVPKDTSVMTVMASVPAHCLLTSNFYESLSLHLTDDNRVIGLTYNTMCLNQSARSISDQAMCGRTAVQMSVDVESEDFGFSTEPIKVEFQYAQLATRLSMEEFLRRAEAGEGETVDGKGRPVQKQQKSFLQQNWLFLLGGAVIVFQLLGTLADPNAIQQQNQAQGQAPQRR